MRLVLTLLIAALLPTGVQDETPWTDLVLEIAAVARRDPPEKLRERWEQLQRELRAATDEAERQRLERDIDRFESRSTSRGASSSPGGASRRTGGSTASARGHPSGASSSTRGRACTVR